MAGENFYLDNPDLQFHLKNRIDWEEMFKWVPEEDRDVVSATTAQEYCNSWLEVLETLGDICGTTLAGNARKVDQTPYKYENGQDIVSKELQENIEALKEFGISSLGTPVEFGGMGAPSVIEFAGAELTNRACPSTMLNVGWYSPIAHIIESFASEELKQEYIPKLVSGEYSGNMALTEPDAGSDLGALRTWGEKQEDGSWKLFGTKRFISNGTSELSLVLAKNEKGSQGLSALSLYLCPRVWDGKENIRVLKLEEKPGLKGSATAELAYDGSKAWILGKEGEGFHYMLKLMNDSRIGVGFQGVGLMESTYRLAQTYASERKTWGKPIEQHELIADILLDLEVELKAIRSLSYQAAYSRTMIQLGEHQLKKGTISPEQRVEIEKKVSENQRLLRRWTPLIKYWVGEKSVWHARQAMQILGGYGFTKEYDAERWVRESLIYSLYEGTSQIQALMCIKDTLKVLVRNPGKFIENALGYRIKSLAEGDPLRKKLLRVRQLSQGAVLSVVLKLLKTNAKAKFSEISEKDLLKAVKKLSTDLIKFEEISPALMQAERICEIQCYEVLANCLVRDAKADESRSWIAERFFYKAIPRIQYLKTLIEQEDVVLNEKLASFEAENSQIITDKTG